MNLAFSTTVPSSFLTKISASVCNWDIAFNFSVKYLPIVYPELTIELTATELKKLVAYVLRASSNPLSRTKSEKSII